MIGNALSFPLFYYYLYLSFSQNDEMKCTKIYSSHSSPLNPAYDTQHSLSSYRNVVHESKPCRWQVS